MNRIYVTKYIYTAWILEINTTNWRQKRAKELSKDVRVKGQEEDWKRNKYVLEWARHRQS